MKPTSVALVQRVEEAELDAMWRFVGSKKYQRWWWYAIDHQTGQIFASVLADHKDDAFKQLQNLLEPFGIQHYYSDGWGADLRRLEPSQHTVGKRNTQKIERKHLTLRTVRNWGESRPVRIVSHSTNNGIRKKLDAIFSYFQYCSWRWGWG